MASTEVSPKAEIRTLAKISRAQASFESACRAGDWGRADELERLITALQEVYYGEPVQS